LLAIWAFYIVFDTLIVQNCNRFVNKQSQHTYNSSSSAFSVWLIFFGINLFLLRYLLYLSPWQKMQFSSLIRGRGFLIFILLLWLFVWRTQLLKNFGITNYNSRRNQIYSNFFSRVRNNSLTKNIATCLLTRRVK
jgi:protein-S-isoprenylcysteine O-methyltransferase Ste14